MKFGLPHLGDFQGFSGESVPCGNDDFRAVYQPAEGHVPFRHARKPPLRNLRGTERIGFMSGVGGTRRSMRGN
jgi:hypothetical protein